jgi:RND family efflux transporter MFP subunit
MRSASFVVMESITSVRFKILPKVALAAVLAVSSVLLSACSRADAQDSTPPPPPKVTVAEVVSREITEWDEFTGRLEAVHLVSVRPRVSGYVAAIRFDEGAMVRKGDLLFEIDARPFQAEADRLRAEVMRVEATVRRAKSDLQRAGRLSSDNAMSPEEIDRRAAFAEESEAQVRAVQAALRAAELNLEFTRVTSPIDGRVGRAIVTAGNLVSSGPGEATLLTTVVSLDPMYASFDADEQTYQRYVNLAREGKRASARQIGLPIQMALPSDEGFPHHGELDFLDNQINSATGTIRGRAIFRNHDRSLTPGSFVRLRLPGSSRHRAHLIQDRAVGTDLDKRYVYVLGKDNKVEYRVVQLGPVIDDLRIVRSGLNAGDLIVINGLQRIRPGAQVQIEKVTMDVTGLLPRGAGEKVPKADEGDVLVHDVQPLTRPAATRSPRAGSGQEML